MILFNFAKVQLLGLALPPVPYSIEKSSGGCVPILRISRFTGPLLQSFFVYFRLILIPCVVYKTHHRNYTLCVGR